MDLRLLPANADILHRYPAHPLSVTRAFCLNYPPPTEGVPLVGTPIHLQPPPPPPPPGEPAGGRAPPPAAGTAARCSCGCGRGWGSGEGWEGSPAGGAGRAGIGRYPVFRLIQCRLIPCCLPRAYGSAPPPCSPPLQLPQPRRVLRHRLCLHAGAGVEVAEAVGHHRPQPPTAGGGGKGARPTGGEKGLTLHDIR